jgi:hypothetical protein
MKLSFNVTTIFYFRKGTKYIYMLKIQTTPTALKKQHYKFIPEHQLFLIYTLSHI